MKIVGFGLGGGFLGLILGYAFGSGQESAFTGMQWGFWIGCGIGLLYALRHPLKAAEDGAKDLKDLLNRSSGTNSGYKLDNGVRLTHLHGNIYEGDDGHTYEKDPWTDQFHRI